MTSPVASNADSVRVLEHQVRLSDLVFSQVLVVVGSSWVGIA